MSEEKSDKKRVVLAYSGGLDTSCILAWLIDKGFEVIAFLADVGQAIDDLEAIRKKALNAGAVKVYVEDLRKEFVTDFIFPMLRANAIYEGRYLLGTSIARPIIAKAQVAIAHKENCKYLAHGATGKGNDQVRFELTANALDPSLVTIVPWRDPEFLRRFKGRQDLLKYASEKGIPVDQTPKASYSIDENMFHTSYESGVLEDPAHSPPAGMFRATRDVLHNAADEPDRLRIEFKNGTPVKAEAIEYKTKQVVKSAADPLDLFLLVNAVGQKHGVGRVDIVENRFVGIKSRGVYETPGGTILRAAHMDIEGITMDREVMALRDMMSPQFAKLTYNGFWYSPEMEFLMTVMDKAQRLVDGSVDLVIFKGNVIVEGRASPYSRYNASLASMDEEGDYNPTDAQGFIRINSLRLKAHRALLQKVQTKEPERLNEFVQTAQAASKQ